MDINSIEVLTRIQILATFPSRYPISATMNNPNTTGNAVIRITTLRSIGFLTAHNRRNVQPVIKVPPIPIISLVCKSGL